MNGVIRKRKQKKIENLIFVSVYDLSPQLKIFLSPLFLIQFIQKTLHVNKHKIVNIWINLKISNTIDLH